MPFKKGDSNINRKGRRKGSQNTTTIPKVTEVMEAIQRNGVKSIKELLTIAKDPNTPANVKMKIHAWLVEQYFTVEDMKKAIKEPSEDSTPKEQMGGNVTSLFSAKAK